MKSLFFSLSVFLQIFHETSVASNITFLYFFSSDIIFFGQKKRIKMQIFETVECSGQNFSYYGVNSVNWQQVNSSSNLGLSGIVMTHNSSEYFKLIHFLLWIKGSHLSPKFQTSECSGENLPCSSCHFLNHNSVFLQIFLHFSFS